MFREFNPVSSIVYLLAQWGNCNIPNYKTTRAESLKNTIGAIESLAFFFLLKKSPLGSSAVEGVLQDIVQKPQIINCLSLKALKNNAGLATFVGLGAIRWGADAYTVYYKSLNERHKIQKEAASE